MGRESESPCDITTFFLKEQHTFVARSQRTGSEYFDCSRYWSGLETGETKLSDNLPLCLFRWWKSSEEWLPFSLWVFGESKVQRKDIVEI